MTKLKMSLKLIPTTLDIISGIVVLTELLKQNRISLFFIGLLIDLLPGPVAAIQFRMLGYSGWRCLSLLFHPFNIYFYSFSVICRSKCPDFSVRIADFAKEVQGILESPLQLVFTSTLIMLRYLNLINNLTTKLNIYVNS